MSGASKVTALREALVALTRGEVDVVHVARHLAAASNAEGRSPEAMMDALEEARALPEAQIREVIAASMDDATAVAAADGREATRVRAPAPEDTGDHTETRVTGPDPRDGGRTDSDWSWSRPEGWRDARRAVPAVGDTLKDRFVLEALIGHGGMGTVYRARDLRREEAEDRDPYVALKLLNDSFREHPEALVALQREAKKAQQLAHPNVVTVYDFDRDGATVFLSMELMRGDPLDTELRGAGAFGIPLRRALQIIDGMVAGLAYAHEQGFAHADFKPGNVFLSETGTVKVLDFGIARAARVSMEGSEAQEQTRFDPASMGAITPAYASAEMLEGAAAEPADDVYALGCVAYELVSGRHPFTGDSGQKIPADEVARRGLRPAPLRRVPRRINRAIERALAPRRDERFPDAGAFRRAIERPARLRRTAVALILLLAALAGVSWWITIRESNVIVSVSDLPTELTESRSLLLEGDDYADNGEMAQAHKLYAQAWEHAQDVDGLSERERSRLRALVDRRVNDVIDHYVARARAPDLNAYDMEVVRLTLESLARHELGGREQELDQALERINRRLSQPSDAADGGGR